MQQLAAAAAVPRKGSRAARVLLDSLQTVKYFQKMNALTIAAC